MNFKQIIPGKILLVFILGNILPFSCISLKTTRDVAAGYHEVAVQYVAQGELDKAILYFEKAVEFNDELNDTKLQLIIAYQKKEFFEKAEQLIAREYRRKISEYNKKLLLLLGNNYFLQEDYIKSRKVFSEYIKSYPEDHLGFYNLGLILQNVSEEEEAYKNYLKAYEISSTFAPTIQKIAEYYKKQNDIENSLRYYRELIETDSKNPEAFFSLGLLEYDLEEYEAAEKHFTKSISLDKENYKYYLWMAKIYSSAYNSKEKTLEYIELALEKGLKEKKEIVTLQEFEKLQKYEKFNALLEKYFK